MAIGDMWPRVAPFWSLHSTLRVKAENSGRLTSEENIVFRSANKLAKRSNY